MTDTYNNVYNGDTFKIVMTRYSDPDRLNMARNAAIYLGKSDRDNIKRPLNIMKQSHVMEVFRGEYAEFEFIDVSKEVYDHLVTYTTRRMRVAGGNRALTSENFTMPSDKMKNPKLVEERIEDSFQNYLWLIDEGETPQVARGAMPVNAKMNPFVYQFNFQTLVESLFTQRIFDNGAQGNTVKVVRGMWELVNRVDPELWSAVYEYYGPHTIEWRDSQRKLRAKKKPVTTAEFIQECSKKITEGTFDYDTTLEEAIRKLYGTRKSMWD